MISSPEKALGPEIALPTHSIVDALQLAVSPVILLSAYGLLLLSMTNRLGRVVDRARQVGEAREGKADRAEQVAIFIRRAKWIRSAILFTALSIFETAVVVLVLFISVLFPVDTRVLVTSLFMVSLICLIIAIIYFIADIFGSLKALEADIELQQ